MCLLFFLAACHVEDVKVVFLPSLPVQEYYHCFQLLHIYCLLHLSDGFGLHGPTMIQIPMFSTLASLVLLFFETVVQYMDIYSATGLTAHVLAWLRILAFVPHLVPASSS